MSTVVLWRPMYDQRAIALLHAAGHRVMTVETSFPQDISRALRQADAVWVRTPEQLTADLIYEAPRLRFISTSGVGTDNIDLTAAEKRGITVVNHPGLGRLPVSEHAILLAMWLLHTIVADGPPTLRDSVTGVIGLGSIGSELARRLREGFGCSVLTCADGSDACSEALIGVTRYGSLADVLARADIVFLTGRPRRGHGYQVGRRELALMGPNTLLINVARGGLLDLDAVREALERGLLGGVGLDVTDPEPLPPAHPLVGHPKVILTPHSAGLTVETSARASFTAARALVDLLAD